MNPALARLAIWAAVICAEALVTAIRRNRAGGRERPATIDRIAWPASLRCR
jgi:hypothetical protein